MEGKQETESQFLYWKGKNLLQHQVDVTEAPRGHTCAFRFGEAERTQVRDRSPQDKHSCNYHLGL